MLVKNTGRVPWTVDSFTDQTFGDVLGGAVGPQVNTCGGDWGLAPGGVYQCAFVVGIAGPAPSTQRSTASITVREEDGDMATSTHVNIIELVTGDPSGGLTITKMPDQSQVPPEGAEVFFSVTITNGTAETVEIHNLFDTEFGDLLDPAAPFTYNDCVVASDLTPSIPPQGSFFCTFSGTVVPPDDGGPHENTVAVEVTVDDEVVASASDTATIAFG